MSTSTSEIIAGINAFFVGAEGVQDIVIIAVGGLIGLIVLGYVFKFFAHKE